tara:strand:+ start:26386 stop:27357 length:972 start_codon:yes stop_codon:yes gene_type:complete
MNKIIINDNIETVTCRICGEQCKRIYGRHLKHSHNNMTTQEYKHLFPNAPITSLKDKRSTSKNSGLHMKTEKYKKMFSEKIKGDKNPMHRSNTNDQFRKEQSPFSKEFYKKRFPDLTEIEVNERISELANSFTKDRILPSNVEYWEIRGYSTEESIKKVSERQTTFSKEICIEKHGKEKGIEVWLNRQEKWHKNYKKSNFSKISQELYQSLWEIIKDNIPNVFFASLNENKEIINSDKNYEYRLKLNESFILPDFFIPKLKKIIEFDGTYYHRPTPENKKREKRRDDNIKNSGYYVLHISEYDYNKNKELTIQKCIDFIYNQQ